MEVIDEPNDSNFKKQVVRLKMAFQEGLEANRVLTLGEASEMFWKRHEPGTPFKKAEPKVLVAFQAGFETPQDSKLDSEALFGAMLFKKFPEYGLGYQISRRVGFPKKEKLELSSQIDFSYDRLPNEANDHYEFRGLLEKWKPCMIYDLRITKKLYEEAQTSDLAVRIREILGQHPEYGKEFAASLGGILEVPK